MRKIFTTLVSVLCLTMSAVGWAAGSQFNPAKAMETQGRTFPRVEVNTQIRKAAADEVSIVPAQGKVQSLQTFTITFNGAKEVTRGNVGYGNAPTVHKTGDPNGDKQFCFNMAFEGNVMTLTVNNEITAEGDWTLTLPAGFYLIDGVESTEPLEFNYTIAPVVVEDGKIIYEAPLGKKVECMTRVLGWAVVNNQLVGQEFAGKPMHYILTDDGCMYIYNAIILNPFKGEQMNTYIKGVKDGDDYVFTFPQPIYEETIDGETKTWYANMLKVEVYDDGGSAYVTAENNSIRMKINEDGSIESSKPMTAPDDCVGVLVDGEWNGFGTTRMLYRVFDFVASEPSADLEVSDAEMEYTNADDEPSTAFLKYGIVDNDIWIQGFGLDVLPEAWVHGTINGNSIVFDPYMGRSDEFGQYVFLKGCEYSESLKTSDVVFKYDKDEMKLTCYTNLCLNSNNEFYYAFEQFQYCVITLLSDDPGLTSRVPKGPVQVSELTAVNSSDGIYDVAVELSNLNTDGQPLDEKRLSFQIILPDEEIYYFQPYRYAGIAKELTEIPYNSDYGFITKEGNIRKFSIYDAKDIDKIGARMIYKDPTGTYYSDIVWYGETGIDDACADEATVQTEWFDLAGRRINAPEKGIYIRVDKTANGNCTIRKVVVK